MDTHKPVTILMVDDQPGKLLSYEVILAYLGENLIKATSASEALEHLLKTDIAVILLDVNMPEIDGFALAAMIRQHPCYQQMAILFISGVHLTDRDMLKGYESGAVDYMTVPIIPELLRAKVRGFVDLYRKTVALQRLEREAQRSQHVLLLGRLAASVSHAIRNPLAAVVLYVGLLEEELREPSPDSATVVQEAFAEIKSQLARLEALMQDYLALARGHYRAHPAGLGRSRRGLGARVAGADDHARGDAPARQDYGAWAGRVSCQYPALCGPQRSAQCPGCDAPGGHVHPRRRESSDTRAPPCARYRERDTCGAAPTYFRTALYDQTGRNDRMITVDHDQSSRDDQENGGQYLWLAPLERIWLYPEQK